MQGGTVMRSHLLFYSMQTTKCYFENGYLDTSVYLWEELPFGRTVQGPAIIIDKNRQECFSLSNVQNGILELLLFLNLSFFLHQHHPGGAVL